MKGLTARQKQIWALKLQGLSRDVMAQELGIDKGTVGNAITTIRKKLGLFKKRGEINGSETEIKNPDVAAAAIDAAADGTSKSQAEAIDRVNMELKAAGIPGRVSAALVRRMKIKYGNAIMVKKAASIQEMVRQLDENINLIDEFIDPVVVGTATLKDLAYAKATFIEKRQLLSGAPTQIISDSERKQLAELLPMIVAEGQRRGITIDITPEKEHSAESK